MKILCVLNQSNYGDPKRGEGYEYVNFIPAFRRLGHDVVCFDNWERARYRNYCELNEALLRAVEQHQPDVIFSVLVYFEIWRETWLILRDAGIATTVNWATDDSWRYAEFSRWVAPNFHAFATTYPAAPARYQHDGIHNVLLTQWAANAEQLQPPQPASECQYAVSFIGTAHGTRRAWIEALRQRGIAVTCFGQGWEHGPVAAAEIPCLIRNSVISLNLANSVRVWEGLVPRQTNQIKARTFEVPGAGGFLLTEWAEGLERYYVPDKEISVFRDLNDAAEKIRYYLAHPTMRDAIARTGYVRTRAEHTYDQRFAEVLAFALRRRDEYDLRRSGIPSRQIDWARFGDATQQHTMNRRLGLLKRALTAIGTAVWGPALGPRAARRLIFELSWRLVGARTYSAAGLPGRMFYEAS